MGASDNCGLKARPRRAGSLHRVRALLLATAVAASWGQPAAAETLVDAMTAAYETNPRLDAERARLRATDEEVARANSGWRPKVEAGAQIGAQRTETDPASRADGSSEPWGYELSVSQPVFTGFRTVNAIGEAEANVRAGREGLRQVEAETLLDAVRAYAAVVRDQAIVRIRDNNVAVLTRELEASETRRAAREVTRTDVAQAQARRARAISQADLAKANLKISRALYERVVGHAPAALVEPPLKLRSLPANIEEAIEVAERENPIVGSAIYLEEAARYGVDKTWGELLPEVSVEANFSQRGQSSSLLDEQEEASITGRVSMPLYEGGEVHARVRQAKHTHVSRLQEIEQARSEAQETVTAAWSRLVAARAQLRSDEIQVEANRLALEGVREEERVGQRLLLDVLNAEQELLEAQEQVANTRHDIVVASYALLSAMGRLTGEQIIAEGMVYDAEQHYLDVRDRWFGLSISHADGRSEIVVAPDAEADALAVMK